METIEYYLNNPDRMPIEVLCSDYPDSKKFELRFDLIDQFIGCVFSYGRNKNGQTIVSFSPIEPNPDFPDYIQDRLSWLWLIFPERDSEIIQYGDEQFKKMLLEYKKKME